MSLPSAYAIAGPTTACSFILVGNAIAQTFMSVPALVVDFPQPPSPSRADRTRLLGRQWACFWRMGNGFFRPVSTAGALGYAYATWAAGRAGRGLACRLFATAAACQIVVLAHSAVNMQPLNAKLYALGYGKGDRDVDEAEAEGLARRWARLNVVRIVAPAVAGSLALWGLVESAGLG